MNTLGWLRERLLDLRIFLERPRWTIPGGHERIYHVHIRKTGGTSLNAAFWALGGLDPDSFGRHRLALRGGKIFLRHDKRRIERGNYFYAHAHIPRWQLDLPPGTFTITILRDPLDRLVSHYRMLRWAREDPEAPSVEPFWASLIPEMEWLGSSFDEFLQRIPTEHLVRQLYMFSPSLDVDEALERLAGCSAVCRLETLRADLAALSKRLGFRLEEKHERRSPWKVRIPAESLERARQALHPEYVMMDRLPDSRIAEPGAASDH